MSLKRLTKITIGRLPINNIGWIVFIFVIGWGIRIAYIYQIMHSPMAQRGGIPSVPDWFSKAVLWRQPLYAYTVLGLYNIFHHNHFLTKISLAFMGAINCILTYEIGKKTFNIYIGRIASLLAVFYGPFIFFEEGYNEPPLAIFLAQVILLLLIHTARLFKIKKILFFNLGILFGLAILVRPHYSFFIPFAILWFVLYSVNKTVAAKQTLIRMIIFIFGIIVIIAPVTLRNYIVAHDFVIIASHGGISFYDGNNPDYLKNFGIRGGFGWNEMLEIPQAERLAIGITKASQKSAYFYNKGMEFIRKHPAQFLKLYVIKLSHFWNGLEIMSVVDMYFYRQFSPIMRILVWNKGLAFPFGIVGPLALFGIIAALSKHRHNGNAVLLFLFFMNYMIINILYVVNDRYRAPAVPTLLIFAGYTIYWLYRRFKDRLCVRTFLVLIPLAFFILICNINKPAMSVINQAVMYGRQASIARRQKDFKKMLNAYKKQVEVYPDNPSAHVIAHLAVAYKQMGMLDEALSAFQESSIKKPREPRWYFEIAQILLTKKDYDGALSYFKRVIMLGSKTKFYSKAQFYIGEIYENKGMLKEAADSYRKLYNDVNYKDISHEKLAVIYEKLKDMDAALREYKILYRKSPDNTQFQAAIKRLTPK